MSEAEVTLDRILSARREAAPEVVPVDEPMVKLVVFELRGEVFAFSAEGIREILSGVAVYFLPGCPAFLEGVIDVRGDIESVIGLDGVLGLSASEAAPPAPDQPTVILLGRAGGIGSGIRVDRVLDVCDLPQSALQPSPQVLADPVRRFALGVLSYRGRPATLLDLGRLLEDCARGSD